MSQGSPLAYTALRTQPRADLNQEIPLPRPFRIDIEPTNKCNFHCTMCPESRPDYRSAAGYYQDMTPETFDHIVDDLATWGKIKSLKFYNVGEPLLNRHLPAMIRQATDAGIAERTELTTNLSVLTEASARALVRSGLDYVRISIYGLDPEQHRRITGNPITPEQIREKARMFRQIRSDEHSTTPRLFAKCFATSAEEVQRFYELYAGVVDETGVETLHNWGNGMMQLDQGKQEPNQTPCAAPFYSLAIHANGDVSPCCVDWQSQLKIGNVNQTHLWQIWNSHALERIQVKHLTGQRPELSACVHCTQTYPDQITADPTGYLERRSARRYPKPQDESFSSSYAFLPTQA